MSDIRGIHYEISKPVQNRDDRYYYQRIRQVDENGNLVGIGEEVHRSLRPDSTDGLVGLPIDLGKLGTLAGDVGQTALGGATRNLGTFARGAVKFARDVTSGATQDYKSWSGTDKPWEPPFDWRTGSPGIDFVQGTTPDATGDGNGIGNWWNNPRSLPQSPLQGDAWANVPTTRFSPPRLPGNSPWRNVFVRDSAAAAGIPSRNNVFEYGFPESGPGQLSTAGAPPARRQGALSVPFDSSNSMGGIPGLIATVAGMDPSNLEQPMPPAGGLLGLIQEYMRNNPASDAAR